MLACFWKDKSALAVEPDLRKNIFLRKRSVFLCYFGDGQLTFTYGAFKIKEVK